ncbi:hypothetical protein BGZ83_001443 [Gryganskiella cystojenkinii]|nr:hypothetical protein BGZ83_001443 [Gryganskiella cystojenkinii]
MKFISISTIALLVLSALVAAAPAHKPTVYLIRHGEKPSNDGKGLNSDGEKRAQCLRKIFGAKSKYNIGFIMAQQFKPDGSRKRPFLTVSPLAKDLHLSVNIKCDRDDAKCVQKAVSNYKGSGNILICWEHDALTNIAKSLGDKTPPTYPDEKFGQIWTDLAPYADVTTITEEDCKGLGQ